MAASDVAVPIAPVKQETDGTMVAAHAGPFESCVWGDFFATYTPPPSQMSEEWMRERVDKLKGEVNRMFEASKTMTAANAVTLVDTVERLGIRRHFRDEINFALRRIRADEQEFANSNDLHIIALRFRLLRQHGFWVSADVFNKFKDSNGSFSSAGLCDKTKDLLSLYNAAHMAIPGETILDDAITFTRRQLEAVKGKLGSPMLEQVSRALDIPLPRFMERLEAMHYVIEYEMEEKHDAVLLELARLDFNHVRSIYLKELSALSLWWRALFEDVNLNYSRDRIVENYFWTIGMIPWEESSRSRIILTKIIGLATLMDDTYDVHATFEECQRFDEAIQRWDESAVSILPDYLHALYIQTLSHFNNEFKDMMKSHEKHRVSYLIKDYKVQSKLYLQEAKWSNENTLPTFKEQVDVSAVSSFVPALCLVVLVGAEEDVATKEAFEWALGMPEMYIGSGKIGRFLNDVASYKKGKNKKDVASSIECYVKENGVTGEEAAAAITAMVEHAWRRMNQEYMEMDRAALPAADIVVGTSRTLEVIYLGGRDAYTFGRELKDIIVPLLLEPIPI